MKPSSDNDRNDDEKHRHPDTTPVSVDPATMSIHQDVKAHVTFDASTAGFHNTVGMYTYDSTGKVTSTQLLFGDVSTAGVTGGASALDVALKAGDHIGFFVAPNADNNGAVLDLIKQGGLFHLVDATDGQTANVTSGHQMQIAYESPTGQWSNVHTQYWTQVFSTNSGDNSDGFQHSKVTVDAATGKVHVAFEDQLGGGDHNWHDANFTVDLGRQNARHLTPGLSGKGDHDDGNGPTVTTAAHGDADDKGGKLIVDSEGGDHKPGDHKQFSLAAITDTIDTSTFAGGGAGDRSGHGESGSTHGGVSTSANGENSAPTSQHVDFGHHLDATHHEITLDPLHTGHLLV